MRVENGACPGTPDIECTLGWIECKYLERWPSRVPIVKCEHYTPQQRVWHVKRSRAGGRVFVMIQIARDYLLFRGEVAAEHLGRVDEATLRSVALGSWHGTIDDRELIAKLKGIE